jgi:hypothetical protein
LEGELDDLVPSVGINSWLGNLEEIAAETVGIRLLLDEK